MLARLSVWVRCRFAYCPPDATATHYLLLHTSLTGAHAQLYKACVLCVLVQLEFKVDISAFKHGSKKAVFLLFLVYYFKFLAYIKQSLHILQPNSL